MEPITNYQWQIVTKSHRGKAAIGMGKTDCGFADDVSSQELDDFVVTTAAAPPTRRIMDIE